MRGTHKPQDLPQAYYTAFTTPHCKRLPSPSDSPEHALRAARTALGCPGQILTLTLMPMKEKREDGEKEDLCYALPLQH